MAKAQVKVKIPDPEVAKKYPYEVLEFDSKQEARSYVRKMLAAGIQAKLL